MKILAWALAALLPFSVLACKHDDDTARDPSMTTMDSGTTDPDAGSSTGATNRTDTTTTTAAQTTPQRVPPPDTAGGPNQPPAGGATGNSAGGATANVNANPNANNTGVNERDRGGNTPTPIDQGNSKAEIDITASIRRQVVGDGTLGMDAKNVKIITNGTKVYLRGPVASDRERQAIEAYARKTAGVTAVENQLEVKK